MVCDEAQDPPELEAPREMELISPAEVDQKEMLKWCGAQPAFLVR